VGVLYSVWPLDDRMREALAQLGHRGTPSQADGRNPTPAEIRRVVGGLSGFKCSFNDPPRLGRIWQACVEHAGDPDRGGWTLINMSQYAGERAPADIWFEKGWPDLIVQIAIGLAEACGPLVIVPDTGESPLLVNARDDVATLLARWDHVNPTAEPDGPLD
jgi:hypothetical protein